MLIASLKTIRSKYVIFNFEDQIPIKKVINSDIIETLNFMEENSVGFVQIWQNNFFLFPSKLKFINIPYGTKYRMSCSTGVWNRDFFLSCLNSDESPWKFEKDGSFREKTTSMPVYKTNLSLFRYLNVQRKGKIRFKAKNIFLDYQRLTNRKFHQAQFQSQLSYIFEQITSFALYLYNLLSYLFNNHEN
jgi:hypothetical protein